MGLLFENCIVDASILFICCRIVDHRVSPWGRGVRCGDAENDILVIFAHFRAFMCVKVSKGAWWMPWQQEPKKDVGICDKPGGVDNRTLIPGFPNGETPHDVSCDHRLNT